MLLYTLKENKNEKLPDAKGLWYAYAITTQMMGVDGLAAHMAGHNTPFSKGAIKGMITDMAFCIKELCLQGISVKIDDLAIFSIGIKNKVGAKSEKEFSIAKNIEGYKLRSRGTGELAAGNLDVEVKKVSSLLASEMQVPGVDDPGSGNDPGSGKDPGSESTPGSENNPGSESNPGSGNTPGSSTDEGKTDQGGDNVNF
ncbi:DNA-binding protein [Segatella copri]|uniref:DNA-binding protein n=1 Tax=Segatella copri TaxID=165179 RepID=A0A6G1VN49_9BACT|nr:DNA-binding protein [Segatella copri]MQN61215.1 DNA-binding protein [Segatella copri]MQP14071.1 DNA-binding protein [Segatella copri]